MKPMNALLNALMPGEHNYMRGKPMPGQIQSSPLPEMGAQPLQAQPQAMTSQPPVQQAGFRRDRGPLMNALGGFFEFAAPEAYDAGRQRKLGKMESDALGAGKYDEAGRYRMQAGDFEGGAKIADYGAQQAATARQQEAQKLVMVMSSAAPQQLTQMAMSDPAGFEQATGQSSEEYLSSMTRLMQQGGMSLEDAHAFVLKQAQAEAGMQPSQPQENKIVGNRLINPVTGEVVAEYAEASKPIEVNGILVDPNTYQPIADFRTPSQRGTERREIWQSAGDGVIFNQATGEYRQVAGGGGQGGGGAGGNFASDPAADNFYIPTSGMADNPFLQLQFGANLTQGAPTLFDNGELYTPGGQGGQPGGGTPPNIDPGMYERYRSSEYAKNDAKIQKQARESAIQITTQVMPQIAQMKQLAREFPSGALSDLRYEAGRWVPFTRGNVGMTEAQMASRDSFVSQAKTYVLSLAENMKGSLSDSDRVWVESMGAKTNMNDESIQQVLNVAEKMAERQEFYAQGAEVWSNQYGGLSMTDQNGKNFYQAWSDWSSQNPITGGTYGGDSPTKGADQSKAGSQQTPIRIQDAAGYASVPSGAYYVAPDGTTRRKP